MSKTEEEEGGEEGLEVAERGGSVITEPEGVLVVGG